MTGIIFWGEPPISQMTKAERRAGNSQTWRQMFQLSSNLAWKLWSQVLLSPQWKSGYDEHLEHIED